MKSYTL